MSDQRCGTCRHWRPIARIDGVCAWPVPHWLLIASPTMTPEDGADCPTWEATDE